MPNFLITVKRIKVASVEVNTDDEAGMAKEVKDYLETIDDGETIISVTSAFVRGDEIVTIVHTRS